jgi:hypothetical protein
MSRNTRSSLLMAALLLPMAFPGCSQNQPTAPEKSSAAATAPVATPATTPAAAAPASAPAASAPPAAAPAAPATNDGDLPGLKTAINELKRTSSTLTLKFTVINSSDNRYNMQGVFDGDGFGRFRHLGGVHLIDAASKKKYFVVTDADGNFLSSNNIPNIAPKSQITVWAKFPAPPDEVQKITVEIPHFVPVEDVPIVR